MKAFQQFKKWFILHLLLSRCYILLLNPFVLLLPKYIIFLLSLFFVYRREFFHSFEKLSPPLVTFLLTIGPSLSCIFRISLLCCTPVLMGFLLTIQNLAVLRLVHCRLLLFETITILQLNYQLLILIHRWLFTRNQCKGDFYRLTPV